MNKTTIKFWRGLRTIGGNIAEIRYGNDRVIFDFGLVFDPAAALLEGSSDRGSRYLHDSLRLGMIPAIDGIYSESEMDDTSFYHNPPNPFEDSKWNTCVFVSHLHIDHMGALNALAPKVPVYMSQESADLYKALVTIEEESLREREITAITGSIEIGAIKITPYRVDHDIAGSLSLLVETPDLKVLYSGDLRMHGKHPEWNEAWVKAVADVGVDVLLMEGTTFRPQEANTAPVSAAICQSEKEMANAAHKMIDTAKGLAIFNIYHRNIDRIDCFVQAAKQSGRQLVLEPETAFIADQFLKDTSFLIFDSNKANRSEWKQDLFTKYKQISLVEINLQSNQYVLQNSFLNLGHLLDLDLKNSVYIHSNGMPLGDYDPNYGKLLAYLERFDVKHQSLDISGHASQSDILSIVDQIKPGLLVPWHSHFPELMQPLDDNLSVFLPESEVTYVYEDKELIPHK